MATSPIYGWLEPDNTDLVKNGALAIRTLGNAIDTTMATMTPKSIVDAKGDLIAASANDTPARLAVGANGETLVADSSTSTGLRYTAGTVQANPVLNSAYQVWQRGTSIAAASTVNVYTADRWMIGASGASGSSVTISRQATGDTTNLPSIQYCARVQRNSGQTGTATATFSQSIETLNSIPFVGKTVTISFYARRGANYSPTGNVLSLVLYSGTATDGNIQTGPWTGIAGVADTNATLTTTWQRFTATGTVSATATQLGVYFSWSPTGTAGANDFFEITGVQIDIGSVALPFRTYAGTIQGELAACQRYYWRAGGNSVFQQFGNGLANSTTIVQAFIANPVYMRIAPSSIDFANLGVTDSVSTTAVSAVTVGNAGTNGSACNFTVASGLTQFRPYIVNANNSTSAYIGFSAEL